MDRREMTQQLLYFSSRPKGASIMDHQQGKQTWRAIIIVSKNNHIRQNPKRNQGAAENRRTFEITRESHRAHEEFQSLLRGLFRTPRDDLQVKHIALLS